MTARTPAALLLLGLVSCGVGPTPTGLRYAAADTKGWTASAEGVLACSLLGARCLVDLHPKAARIEVVVENRTAAPIEVRIGPEATRDPTAAIGEFQTQPIERQLGQDLADFEPYVSLQPARIEVGSQTKFYLDTPLGREPTVGQYLVLVIEAEGPGQQPVRKLLPLVATNAPAAGSAAARERAAARASAAASPKPQR